MRLQQLLLGLALWLSPEDHRLAAGSCDSWFVTGYSSAQFPNSTADGTPTIGNEWQIAAAHQSIPFGTYIRIDGLGTFRVADRGQLGPRHLDVLVRYASEAYALTDSYNGCIL